MAQYIDKDALVTKIKSKLSSYERKYKELAHYEVWGTANEIEHKIEELKGILSLIDTLEVKEVDLDEAARKWEDKVYLEKGWQDEHGTPHAPFSEIGNAFREGAKFILKIAQKGE